PPTACSARASEWEKEEFTGEQCGLDAEPSWEASADQGILDRFGSELRGRRLRSTPGWCRVPRSCRPAAVFCSVHLRERLPFGASVRQRKLGKLAQRVAVRFEAKARPRGQVEPSVMRQRQVPIEQLIELDREIVVLDERP